MIELTRNVERSAQSLLQVYKTDTLYAFRVNSRRIRSILKHMDSHRSRSHRKTWGGFAAATNDARDWDVFLDTAKHLLDHTKFEAFEGINRGRVAEARALVTEMLATMHWRNYLVQWRRFLETAEEGQGRDDTGATLSSALTRVREARAVAEPANDDHDWHRFRISVKELRYVADALGDNDELVAECKKLQTLLGDWHDTVVQLNILDEIPQTAVHEELRQIISARRADFLSQTRDFLRGHPLFGSAGKSGT